METTTIIQGDPIWIEDYSQLIRRDKLLDVIPAIGMPFSERINAIVRASIYLGIIFI